ERGPGKMACVSTSSFLLPRIPLPLIEQIPSGDRGKPVSRSRIVGEVRFPPPGQCDERRVVPIFVPETVDAMTVRLVRHQPRNVLRLALRDHVDAPWRASVTATSRELVDDIPGRTIDNRMRGVEAKSVEVILLQPMANIGPH